MDRLQNQIRKLKNPAMVLFCLDGSLIPPQYLDENGNIPQAYCSYAKALLTGVNGVVPAVRFSFGSFAVFGADGLGVLEELLRYAQQLEFYILLDAPEIWSTQQANLTAEILMGSESSWIFDGLLLPSYMGSDLLKPFVARLKNNDKDLFAVLRTANKSAPEMQDLLTGSRLVYTVAADTAKRLGESSLERCGYSRVAGVGPATSADTLLSLRSKYPSVFLLIDGYDYSGANAKNCACAFDKLGHGAIACAGTSVTAAWKEADIVDIDPVKETVLAAERMKKNLTRYVTIL